jgi:hypothetical protein
MPFSQDDVVVIGTAPPGGPTQPQGTTNIKTFRALDLNGNLVEIQAVVAVDELGRVLQRPMTEETGQQILAALVNMTNTLVEFTNCGSYLQQGEGVK